MPQKYVKIDLQILKNNILNILDFNKKTNNFKYIFGVVKGNAYGHGFGIVKTLLENGINYLACASLEEALEIRKVGKNIPILILQPIQISSQNIKNIASENISITISSLEYLEKLSILFASSFPKDDNLQNAKIKVHIKIDTGMNRLGIKDNRTFLKSIEILKSLNNFLEIEGLYTHFATSGIYDSYLKFQKNNFAKITERVDLGVFKIIHTNRSLNFISQKKEMYENGVRLGIAMYGFDLDPRKNKQVKSFKNFIKNIFKFILGRSQKQNINLIENKISVSPAFSFMTEVIEIKELSKGDFVNYGNSFKNEYRNKKIAVIPVGYGDGFSKSNLGRYVYINNKAYKIVGEINMQMMTVLVDEKVRLGDAVEILGENTFKENRKNVYELITSLQKYILRIYQ